MIWENTLGFFLMWVRRFVGNNRFDSMVQGNVLGEFLPEQSHQSPVFSALVFPMVAAIQA